MPGLGARLGRGGATTTQQSLADSDCIVIMGANMAENHPVGFRFAMKAKQQGATIIHIDPRFTRTSALADIHVPLRVGSDLVFLGALVNYVLGSERFTLDPFFQPSRGWPSSACSSRRAPTPAQRSAGRCARGAWASSSARACWAPGSARRSRSRSSAAACVAGKRASTVLGSLLTLAGGLCLRYVMVMAGRASAADPAATFEFARRDERQA